MFEYLKSDSTIVFLNLSGNFIDNHCMKSLVETLKVNKTLKKLWFGEVDLRNQISDAGLDILLPALYGQKTLKELSFYGMYNITDQISPKIVDCIRNSMIYEINVQSTGINNLGPISAALSVNKLRNGSTSLKLNSM